MESVKNILSGPPLLQERDYESVGNYLFEMMSKYDSAVSMVCAESTNEYHFNQTLEESLKLAVALQKLGLSVDDRIAICSSNSVNYGFAILSSIFLGTTLCPLNPAYTERELIHTLTISKPKCAFVSTSSLPVMQKVLENLSWSMKLILLSSDDSVSKIPNLPYLVSTISNSELKNFKLPEIDIKNHVVLIACSSGTTGLPKGVMLTDKNILTVIQSQKQDPAGVIMPDSTVLGMLPMYHSYAYFTFLISMAFKAKVIIFPKFGVEELLKAVEKYRISTLTVVPPIMAILANYLKNQNNENKYDLSSVTRIMCGGAPLSEKIATDIMHHFQVPFICSGYGMTELSLSVISSPEVHKVKSIGVLRPGVLAKIIPLDGKSTEALGPHCEGEMCFKTDSIMKGYCGDEEATKAVIDDDGFLHTGDVGYYDEEGFFYYVERVKELIKYNAFQVPPAELEGILLTHPGIKDAAVVGLPDEVAGELPLAFVVKQPETEITEEEIIKYVEERVSPQKRLRGGVRFIEAIPKNPSGKILRRVLRDMLKK